MKNKNQNINTRETTNQFDFKKIDDANVEDIISKEFKKGLEEANKIGNSNNRYDDFFLDNDSRSMHR